MLRAAVRPRSNSPSQLFSSSTPIPPFPPPLPFLCANVVLLEVGKGQVHGTALAAHISCPETGTETGTGPGIRRKVGGFRGKAMRWRSSTTSTASSQVYRCTSQKLRAALASEPNPSDRSERHASYATKHTTPKTRATIQHGAAFRKPPTPDLSAGGPFLAQSTSCCSLKEINLPVAIFHASIGVRTADSSGLVLAVRIVKGA